MRCRGRVPVLVAAVFAKKSPEDKATQQSLCAISFALVVAAFLKK